MMVSISEKNYEKIVTHGKCEFPNECCGLLGGIEADDKILIKEVYELQNMDKSSEHFSMDPREQFAVVKKIRAEGYKLVGNYHSHPYTPSRPSEEDKRLAYDSELIYAILSLEKEEPVLNFFKIIHNTHVEKLEVEII
jgi:proteasome lid subunit RPN8/RPN11